MKQLVHKAMQEGAVGFSTGLIYIPGTYSNSDEVVDLFRPVPSGTVVDATVGGGGHARAILSAVPHVSVLGLDRDSEAITAAKESLAGFGEELSRQFPHDRQYEWRLAGLMGDDYNSLP